MLMKIIHGDLIFLAKQGSFDVITHSCNCFCRMKRGIAPLMAKAFECDRYRLEDKQYEGDIRKLGNIDYRRHNGLVVVNSYMQFHWTTPSRFGIPFDYDACRLCLRKINHEFKGLRLGIPWIGCGLAGGSKELVTNILMEEITDLPLTVVEFSSK